LNDKLDKNGQYDNLFEMFKYINDDITELNYSKLDKKATNELNQLIKK